MRRNFGADGYALLDHASREDEVSRESDVQGFPVPFGAMKIRAIQYGRTNESAPRVQELCKPRTNGPKMRDTKSQYFLQTRPQYFFGLTKMHAKQYGRANEGAPRVQEIYKPKGMRTPNATHNVPRFFEN